MGTPPSLPHRGALAIVRYASYALPKMQGSRRPASEDVAQGPSVMENRKPHTQERVKACGTGGMQPWNVLERLKLHKLPPPYVDGLCPTSTGAEFLRSLCVGKLFSGCHPRRNLHTCLSKCL